MTADGEGDAERAEEGVEQPETVAELGVTDEEMAQLATDGVIG